MNWADRQYCIGRGIGAFRARRGAADTRFMYYALCYDLPRLLSRCAGSVFPNLARSDFETFEIWWPDKPTRAATASILGALDDKIELNRRMNETLEETTQAIFKSWFVDFDPVRAKVEGRQPVGMDRETAALFADSFEPSELGDIPRGWSIIRLGDFASLDKGVSYKGQFFSDEGTPMINLGCLLGGGRFSFQNLKYYTGEYRSTHTVKPGDIVLANTDITQKREVLGSPALVPPFESQKRYIFSHHVYALRFVPGWENWKSFVFFALLQPAFRERAMGFATGTTVLALPRDAVYDYSFAAPPIELLSAFESIVIPLLALKQLRDQQFRTLALVRDALLPKLLSGEIRVKDAEANVGAAV
jgi:type I restriction enzyme S subunit